MRFWICLLGGLCWAAMADLVVAVEPLSAQIDNLVSAKFEGRQPAAVVDDAVFLRRIWLDLAGRVPDAEQTRRFIADASPEKRAKMVDQLLAAPTYQQHMENLFHSILLERRGDNPEWRKFLRAAFEKNLPWDEIVKNILGPNDQDEELRGAAFFYTERLKSYGQNPVDYPGLTRDVGRLFLGVDLQCAQCHNHLTIMDYDQQEFQGLFAIYKTLSIQRGDFPAVKEKPITEKLEFVSVFDPTERVTGPRIPFGKEFELPKVAEEDAKKGDKKKADKKKDNKKKEDEGPEFSVLELIATNLPSADNKLFSKTIVNRLWFQMMGRGLVEPLDQFHSDNPPSHPELLDLLAEEFAAHDFDIKWMLRQLALTETYQRSSTFATDQEAPAPETFLVAIERRLSAEQLLTSTLIATGNFDRLSKVQEQVEAKAKGEEDKKKSDAELAKAPITELKERFLKAFANEAREPEVAFTPSVKGALFILNDEKVLELIRPQPGNLIERLIAIDDPAKRTDELFLSLFNRYPTDEERKAVDAYIEENLDRLPVAVEHVVWGMISSAEFCINH